MRCRAAQRHSALITCHSSLITFFGGHEAVVRPVPIPNTAVKRSVADGSACIACARVGSRQFFNQGAGRKSGSLLLRVGQGADVERRGVQFLEACRITAASFPGFHCGGGVGFRTESSIAADCFHSDSRIRPVAAVPMMRAFFQTAMTDWPGEARGQSMVLAYLLGHSVGRQRCSRQRANCRQCVCKSVKIDDGPGGERPSITAESSRRLSVASPRPGLASLAAG